MSNFDENVVTKLKRLEREIERLKTGSEKANPDGWIPVSATWTYASATTITVPSGAASIYKVGQGIRLTQTSVKYFYVIGVANTTLTITGGSDYTLANAAISAVSYTNTPGTAIGFPAGFTIATNRYLSMNGRVAKITGSQDCSASGATDILYGFTFTSLLSFTAVVTGAAGQYPGNYYFNDYGSPKTQMKMVAESAITYRGLLFEATGIV